MCYIISLELVSLSINVFNVYTANKKIIKDFNENVIKENRLQFSKILEDSCSNINIEHYNNLLTLGQDSLDCITQSEFGTNLLTINQLKLFTLFFLDNYITNIKIPSYSLNLYPYFVENKELYYFLQNIEASRLKTSKEALLCNYISFLNGCSTTNCKLIIEDLIYLNSINSNIFPQSSINAMTSIENDFNLNHNSSIIWNKLLEAQLEKPNLVSYTNIFLLSSIAICGGVTYVYYFSKLEQ